MIPGLEMLACQDLAVPMEVMEHVVRVESSLNPYAIGVVGARLARQPRSLDEAVATATQLERDGYNFSLGLAQVNRHNLTGQGLVTYEQAFAACPNLAAGARILADCHQRSGGDWGKALSCYYSGNFTRGFRDGYVEKVRRSMAAAGLDTPAGPGGAIPVKASIPRSVTAGTVSALRARRSVPALSSTVDDRPAEIPLEQAPADAAGPASSLRPGSRGASADAPFVPEVTGRRPQPRPSQPASHGGDAAFVF